MRYRPCQSCELESPPEERVLVRLEYASEREPRNFISTFERRLCEGCARRESKGLRQRGAWWTPPGVGT